MINFGTSPILGSMQEIQSQIDQLIAEKQHLLQLRERAHNDLDQMWKALWWLIELLKNERDATDHEIDTIDQKIATYHRLLTKMPSQTMYESAIAPVEIATIPGTEALKHILAKQVKTG